MPAFLEGQLVAGLSGVELEFQSLELGEGLRLAKTYAHLMAPYMMAFKQAPPGGHHPGPWKAACGGFGFDVTAELVVPLGFCPSRWGNRLNVIKWIIALLRLWASPNATAPVLSNMPFADAAEAEDDQVTLVPYETLPRGIVLEAPEGTTLTQERLAWVVEHWQSGSALQNEDTAFHLAFEALDQVHFVRDPGLALVSTWAAIESLFSPAKAELRFRVSALLASYLEPPGSARRALQKRLQKLYDARCSAAHGKVRNRPETLVETMQVLREAIIKMISAQHIPSSSELDGLLFGEENA